MLLKIRVFFFPEAKSSGRNPEHSGFGWGGQLRRFFFVNRQSFITFQGMIGCVFLGIGINPITFFGDFL